MSASYLKEIESVTFLKSFGLVIANKNEDFKDFRILNSSKKSTKTFKLRILDISTLSSHEKKTLSEMKVKKLALFSFKFPENAKISSLCLKMSKKKEFFKASGFNLFNFSKKEVDPLHFHFLFFLCFSELLKHKSFSNATLSVPKIHKDSRFSKLKAEEKEEDSFLKYMVVKFIRMDSSFGVFDLLNKMFAMLDKDAIGKLNLSQDLQVELNTKLTSFLRSFREDPRIRKLKYLFPLIFQFLNKINLLKILKLVKLHLEIFATQTPYKRIFYNKKHNLAVSRPDYIKILNLLIQVSLEIRKYRGEKSLAEQIRDDLNLFLSQMVVTESKYKKNDEFFTHMDVFLKLFHSEIKRSEAELKIIGFFLMKFVTNVDDFKSVLSQIEVKKPKHLKNFLFLISYLNELKRPILKNFSKGSLGSRAFLNVSFTKFSSKKIHPDLLNEKMRVLEEYFYKKLSEVIARKKKDRKGFNIFDSILNKNYFKRLDEHSIEVVCDSKEVRNWYFLDFLENPDPYSNQKSVQYLVNPFIIKLEEANQSETTVYSYDPRMYQTRANNFIEVEDKKFFEVRQSKQMKGLRKLLNQKESDPDFESIRRIAFELMELDLINNTSTIKTFLLSLKAKKNIVFIVSFVFCLYLMQKNEKLKKKAKSYFKGQILTKHLKKVLSKEQVVFEVKTWKLLSKLRGDFEPFEELEVFLLSSFKEHFLYTISDKKLFEEGCMILREINERQNQKFRFIIEDLIVDLEETSNVNSLTYFKTEGGLPGEETGLSDAMISFFDLVRQVVVFKMALELTPNDSLSQNQVKKSRRKVFRKLSKVKEIIEIQKKMVQSFGREHFCQEMREAFMSSLLDNTKANFFKIKFLNFIFDFWIPSEWKKNRKLEFQYRLLSLEKKYILGKINNSNFLKNQIESIASIKIMDLTKIVSDFEAKLTSGLSSELSQEGVKKKWQIIKKKVKPLKPILKLAKNSDIINSIVFDSIMKLTIDRHKHRALTSIKAVTRFYTIAVEKMKVVLASICKGASKKMDSESLSEMGELQRMVHITFSKGQLAQLSSIKDRKAEVQRLEEMQAVFESVAGEGLMRRDSLTDTDPKVKKAHLETWIKTLFEESQKKSQLKNPLSEPQKRKLKTLYMYLEMAEKLLEVRKRNAKEDTKRRCEDLLSQHDHLHNLFYKKTKAFKFREM